MTIGGSTAQGYETEAEGRFQIPFQSLRHDMRM